MKAIVEQRYGSTEVLELQDVGQPGIAKTRCCPRAGHRGGPRRWHVRPTCRTPSASRGTCCRRSRPRARLGPGPGRDGRRHGRHQFQAGDVDVTVTAPRQVRTTPREENDMTRYSRRMEPFESTLGRGMTVPEGTGVASVQDMPLFRLQAHSGSAGSTRGSQREGGST